MTDSQPLVGQMTQAQSVRPGPALREQVFSSYIDVIFPSIENQSTVDLWPSLITTFSKLPQKTRMLETAISAISCAYLGKLKRDKRVFQHGIQLYNVAIRQMSSMINQDYFCDDIIYTTIIFQEMELCYCPDGLQTWFTHISGTNAILSHYRRRAKKTPLVDSIYHEHQKLVIVYSTKGIEMSKQDYDYIMEPFDGKRTPLLDLLALFAGFTPLAAAIHVLDPSNRDAFEKVLQKCVGHQQKIIEWYSKVQIVRPFSCSPDDVLCERLSTDHVLGPALRFISLDNARLHMMFWTLLCIIHPIISRVRILARAKDNQSALRATSVDDPILNQLDDEDQHLSFFYANQIGRSIPYCVQDTMKCGGFHTVIFSLCQMCKVSVDHGDRERFDWCQRAFGIVAERGFDFSARLQGFFHWQWSLDKNRVKSMYAFSPQWDPALKFATFTQNQDDKDDKAGESNLLSKVVTVSERQEIPIIHF
ncbi:hypothetical protein N7462_005866 [Penicillium macrosclerotiorum]|uniref:uncharacterized protein n=1 Tax=Penicillium macrosclerotiorum TaxID=303699 RepID=UPI0025493612|nr:uncharacterized protein N7462_005866 [Penicillium macrosclerotiorum]KAJ5682701.1 hypothetical protein N7462_005866 [Penicillium macrosclerotiorum]